MYAIKQWVDEIITGPFSLDTETTDIVEGEIPELVIWTAYDETRNTVFWGVHTTINDFIDKHPTNIISMANAAFDLSVLSRIELYKNIDRIHDIQIFWKLLWLAKDGLVPKKYSLALITEYCMDGYEMYKGEDVRMGWYRGMIITEDRLDYACEDAYCTHICWKRLYKAITKQNNLLSYPIQIRGQIALADIERRGIGFDLEAKDNIVDNLTEKIDPLLKSMDENYGYIIGKKGNTKVLLSLIENFIKDNDIQRWPLSEKAKRLSTAYDDLEKYVDKSCFFKAYCEYKKLKKLRDFVIKQNSDRIRPRYDLIKVTGRTGSSGPNIQNQPRGGGIRECYVPRKGCKLIAMDYSYIELVALAQICFKQYGYSNLRTIINDGIDPHIALAKSLLKKEEITKEERQKAKAVNFGFPGGMGIDVFMATAKKQYGVDFTREESIEVKGNWKKMFPEMYKYLEAQGKEPYQIRTLTGRLQSNVRYTQSKNTPFQGLAADGAKLSLWECFKHNLDMVVFAHDEIIIESKEENVEEDFKMLKQCMLKGMSSVIKDVKISVEGKIMDRWEK